MDVWIVFAVGVMCFAAAVASLVRQSESESAQPEEEKEEKEEDGA